MVLTMGMINSITISNVMITALIMIDIINGNNLIINVANS